MAACKYRIRVISHIETNAKSLNDSMKKTLEKAHQDGYELQSTHVSSAQVNSFTCQHQVVLTFRESHRSDV